MLFVNKEISQIVKIYHDLHKYPVPLFSFTDDEKIQVRIKGNNIAIIPFEPVRIAWKKDELCVRFQMKSTVRRFTKIQFTTIAEYDNYRSAFEIFRPKIVARLEQRNQEQREIQLARHISREQRRLAYEAAERAQIEADQAKIEADKAKIEAEKKRIQDEKRRQLVANAPVAPWAKKK